MKMRLGWRRAVGLLVSRNLSLAAGCAVPASIPRDSSAGMDLAVRSLVMMSLAGLPGCSDTGSEEHGSADAAGSGGRLRGVARGSRVRPIATTPPGTRKRQGVPQHVAAGDLNEDGVLDLVVAVAGLGVPDSVQVLLSNP